MKDSPVYIPVQGLVGHKFSIFLDMYVGVELSGHLVISCFNFKGTTKLFIKVALVFDILTSSV